MRAKGARLVGLVLLWVCLWEDVSLGNLLAGSVLAAGILAVFSSRDHPRIGKLRPAGAIKFFFVFMGKLLIASAVVAWEAVTPSSRINEGIVAVPIRGFSEALTTLVANAISLTPGTLTIEVFHNPTILFVHVLHLSDVETVRREVDQLELLAARAFGSDEAIAIASGSYRVPRQLKGRD
ncbi:MAG: Na+/H+ antiporter subunit E [Actinomycetota bacterium]